MECPHCGTMSDEVIDSRPIKEGAAIRRRRRCLACEGRFTTYESTEEQLPFVLMKKGPGQTGVMMHMKSVLTFTTRTLDAVSRELGSLVERVERQEATGNSPSRKSEGVSATDQVLRTIKRHKNGVSIAGLKAKTGYDDSKIGNILYRAHKEGRVKRLRRGFYVAMK